MPSLALAGRPGVEGVDSAKSVYLEVRRAATASIKARHAAARFGETFIKWAFPDPNLPQVYWGKRRFARGALRNSQTCDD